MLYNYFRLFYLWEEDPMLINEESLFKYLTWACPTLSGLMLSMIFGQNYFSSEQDSTVIISSCGKIPKFILMEVSAWPIHLFIIVHLILYFVGLVIQAAMFLKQNELEEEQSAGQWVIHYVNGEIKFQRKNLNTCNHKLSKHKRNVISPLGSFLSFLISAVYNIITICMFFSKGPAGLPIISQFFFFQFMVYILFALTSLRLCVVQH